MSDSLSDLTNAPIVLKIQGKHWEVSALTIADLGHCERFARYEPYTTALALELPPEHIAETLAKCRDAQFDFSTKELYRIAETAAGALEVCYLALRHKHKDITREVVGDWTVEEIAFVVRTTLMLIEVRNDDPVTAKKKLETLRQKLSERNLI